MISRIHDECNAAALLTEIRRLSNELEENVSLYDSLYQAKRKYFSYRQGEDETNAQHLINFRNLVAIAEYYGGDIFFDESLIEYEKNQDSKTSRNTRSNTEYKIIIQEKMKGIGLLKSSNNKR